MLCINGHLFCRDDLHRLGEIKTVVLAQKLHDETIPFPAPEPHDDGANAGQEDENENDDEKDGENDGETDGDEGSDKGEDEQGEETPKDDDDGEPTVSKGWVKMIQSLEGNVPEGHNLVLHLDGRKGKNFMHGNIQPGIVNDFLRLASGDHRPKSRDVLPRVAGFALKVQLIREFDSLLVTDMKKAVDLVEAITRPSVEQPLWAVRALVNGQAEELTESLETAVEEGAVEDQEFGTRDHTVAAAAAGSHAEGAVPAATVTAYRVDATATVHRPQGFHPHGNGHVPGRLVFRSRT